MRTSFSSLRYRNYRIWACGSFVSDVGTWMQRIAQDWLVLTELTRNNATALGLAMALRYGPLVLALPIAGSTADYFDRRKVLLATQVAAGALALGLAVLVLGNWVQLWHVYVFAFVLGAIGAFESPARHTFVSDLVGDDDLANAVALNSATFNLARMIGPAVAGLVIAAVGTGWAFLVNAASFLLVIASLCLIRANSLNARGTPSRSFGGMREGFLYLWNRPELKVAMLMIVVVATFALNFPIFISTMSVKVFGGDSSQYGFLMSMIGVGSVTGAFLTARQSQPGLALLIMMAATLGLGFTLAVVMPNFWLFGFALLIVGASAVAFNAGSSSFLQLATVPTMRGRVIAIRVALMGGGMPLGALLLGWVADALGPRFAVAIGGASAYAACLLGLYFLYKSRRDQVSAEAANQNGFSDDAGPDGL